MKCRYSSNPGDVTFLFVGAESEATLQGVIKRGETAEMEFAAEGKLDAKFRGDVQSWVFTVMGRAGLGVTDADVEV